MKRDPARGLWLPLLLAPVFLALWALLAASLAAERRLFLPGPMQMIQSLWTLRGELLPATLNTALGAGAGFLLAVLASSLVGALLALSRWLRAALFPYLMLLQLIPIVVIAPMLVLWVGAGFASIASITFLICVFPLIVNTTQGLISADPQHAELFRLARATRWQELRLLRIPAALPYFFTGLRIAATLAPIGAVVGDFTAGDSGHPGLGILAILYSANFRYPELFAVVLANACLGFLFAGASTLLARAFLGRWHASYRQVER